MPRDVALSPCFVNSSPSEKQDQHEKNQLNQCCSCSGRWRPTAFKHAPSPVYDLSLSSPPIGRKEDRPALVFQSKRSAASGFPAIKNKRAVSRLAQSSSATWL